MQLVRTPPKTFLYYTGDYIMNTDHIDSSLAKIRTIFEEASDIIDAVKPGEKIPATLLAAQIADKHGMSGAQLYPTLLFLFKDYPGIVIKRGAHGGLMRPKAEEKKEEVAATAEVK
jgi:hypothetical protein